MSEKTGIYTAVSGIMNEVGAIGKNKTNTQQKYNFRGIDDVMNALQPAMIKYGVFAAPQVIGSQREARTAKSGGELLYSILTVKYTFYAQDGSFIEAVVVGEGMDSGDKASNKALAAAFKYACFQVFCIPTEEIKDPDETAPEESEGNKENALKSAASYVLDFGKHKGKTLGEIAKSKDEYTKNYLIYLYESDSTNPIIREKCKLLLDAMKNNERKSA